MIHVVRRDEQTQQSGAKILSTDKQNGGKRGEEEQTVPKHAADIFWLVLPIAAPHENLRTGTKSEDEHKHCDEEDTAECRSSQLHFTHTSQKGRVGHAHQLFDDGTEQEGENNFPNITIRITRATARVVRTRDSFFHCHKVGKYTHLYAIFARSRLEKVVSLRATE